MRDTLLFHSALADENRLRLLHLMKHGEICVCHLQAVLRTNQPKISRHLAYLRRAGLVEARRDGKWMHYKLRQQHGGLQKILSATLEQLSLDPLIRKDTARAKTVGCN